MGWGNCGTDTHGRPIGYNFLAVCDHPGCEKEIDRGLAYACGGMHGDGDPDGSCEGYFCYEHLAYSFIAENFVCLECVKLDEEGDHDEDEPV